MKKTICYIIMAFILFTGVFSFNIVSVDANVRTKTRTIHIVYDDSGSMASNGVTSWSQAKYAMGVFAAMMGENDTLNIYPMSSYSYKSDSSQSDSWGKIITIEGTESAEARVKKIEQMNGDNGLYRNTPIQTVTAAGDALEGDTANEKWLIILTDGIFDRGIPGSSISASETQSTILGYAGIDDINVAYVAIGSGAMSLKEWDSTSHFYPFEADTNNILDTVTKVATVVFNYQSIPVSGNGTYSFSTDIPISRVIIFAQGEGAKIEPLSLDGQMISEKPVSVDVQVVNGTQYYPQNESYNVQFADGLTGRLVTYQSDSEDKPFSAGTYSFDSSVNHIEVYFEPGVEIQPILENANKEEVNLSQNGVTSIEAGEKIVHIRMVNPLTGEMIQPEDSTLLDGAKLTFTMTDSSGGVTNTYSDGDTVVLSEGSIEVCARASFRGDIEKSSEIKAIDVTPARLDVSFTETQYEMDIATLRPNQDILFDVKSGDGTVFRADELSTISFDIAGGAGIEWTVEETDSFGRYKMVPSSKDASSIQADKQQLKIACTMTASGVEKKGEASTSISCVANTELELMLTLELPDEMIGDRKSGKHYMFDPAKRGVQEDAPYIKANVEVLNPDGSTRLLSETEWNAGVDGFSFSSQSLKNGFVWKMIEIICQQGLNFDVVKDTEISSYRIYLSGLSATGIRPNESNLKTTLRIRLSNGLQEEGSAQDTISVKPLHLFSYVGRILTIVGLILLAVIFIMMEMQKKKFDRNMCPNTSAILTRAGVSIRAPLPPQISKKKIKYKIMPPWKAQERDITLKYPGYLDTPITFHCVATGDGSFVIENPKKFQVVKDQVRFDGVKYDAVIEQPIVLNLSSDIIIYVKKGNISGKLIMSFRKSDT